MGVILSLLKSYSQTSTLPEEINFMKDIATLDTFVNKIIQKNPVLKPQPVNDDPEKQKGDRKQKKPGVIDSFSLTLVQLQVIYWCVDSKLKTKV